MILTCNCGEKKFTLPDKAIPAAGRMVQCGSCGLKWKQFPVGVKKHNQSLKKKKGGFKPQPIQKKIQKPKKIKRTVQKNQEKSVCTHQNI